MAEVIEQHDIKSGPECTRAMLAVRDVLDILNGKWKLPIIVALMQQSRRFKEMERAIPGITPKMLTKELRDLEINELVKRTVFDTLPVTVEYSITPYGRSLKKIIMEMEQWGVKHRKRIIGKK